MKTAISETEIEMMVKPISPAPFSAACDRREAFFDVPRDILDHHDGIVDHEADRDGRGPSATGCRGCSCSRYITPNVPISDIGTDTAEIIVAHSLRRNRKITPDHRRDGQQQGVELHVADDAGADGLRVRSGGRSSTLMSDSSALHQLWTATS